VAIEKPKQTRGATRSNELSSSAEHVDLYTEDGIFDLVGNNVPAFCIPQLGP
jgi:hypothetical protein